jgi:DNA primase
MKITFETWCNQMIYTYGDNGKTAIAFYLSTLFSDTVFSVAGASPILFLHGPAGSGKSALANSILRMFGQTTSVIKLKGTTAGRYAVAIGQGSTQIVYMDEYSEKLPGICYESLVCIYYGIGHDRPYSDSIQTLNDHPKCAIVSGQELPTDLILMNKVIVISLQNGFNSDDVIKYKALLDMEKQGLSSISAELIQHKSDFQKSFTKGYKTELELLRSLSTPSVSETRLINRAIMNQVVSSAALFVDIHF